jgi:predicted HTH domain antitoxin
MPVLISDEFLTHAGLSEQEAKIEIACRLYDAQKIGKGVAARFAGMSRDEFEDALIARGLPRMRYTEDMLAQDLETVEHLRRVREAGRADHRE